MTEVHDRAPPQAPDASVRPGALVVGRRLAAEAVAAVAVALGFVCALTWPLAAHLGSRFIGTVGTDAAGGIWWLWHLDRVGYHLFGTTHNPLLAAPFGVEEANWINLQSIVPYAPAVLATKVVGEVAAFNLVVIWGLALSGAAMYALVRFLGASVLVAVWAGVVYVVFPAHLVRLEHGSLTHFEVLVLTLLAVLAAAERPTTARLALVGAATLAAWATFGYFGAMALVGAATCAVAAGFVVSGRRERMRLTVGATAAAFLATALFGVVALLTGGDAAGALDRDVADLSIFGLRPTELVVPPENSLLFDDALRGYHASRTHGSLPTEASNYVGVLTLLLAGSWIVVAWRRRLWLPSRARVATIGLSAVAVVSLLLALPSPIGLVGHLWTWTPARLLYEVLPAFRVPSRWVALLMTALVPLAALGLQAARRAVVRSAGQSERATVAGGALVVVAIALSTLELLIRPLGGITQTDAVPSEYAAVRGTPPGILAEYPLRRSTAAEFWQRTFYRPLLNGAPDDSFAATVTRTLIDPDARGTPERLSLLGITAVLTRPEALDAANGEPPDVPDARWGAGYSLIRRFDDGSSLWRVTALPAPVLASYSGAFGLPDVRADGSVGHTFGGPVGQLELASRRDQVVRVSFEAAAGGVPRTLGVRGRDGRRAIALGEPRRVSLVVHVPVGRSRLELRVPHAGDAPVVELSAPWTERSDALPELEAIPVATGPGF